MDGKAAIGSTVWVRRMEDNEVIPAMVVGWEIFDDPKFAVYYALIDPETSKHIGMPGTINYHFTDVYETKEEAEAGDLVNYSLEPDGDEDEDGECPRVFVVENGEQDTLP